MELQSSGSFWLKFDKLSLRLFGKPNQNDIEKLDSGYYQIFTIIITATDPLAAKISTSFTIFIKLNKPILESPIG